MLYMHVSIFFFWGMCELVGMVGGAGRAGFGVSFINACMVSTSPHHQKKPTPNTYNNIYQLKTKLVTPMLNISWSRSKLGASWLVATVHYFVGLEIRHSHTGEALHMPFFFLFFSENTI